MSAELEHIWSCVQAQLAAAVDGPTYRIWLDPLLAVELSDGRLLIEAPPHACRWVRDRFGKVLKSAVEVVLRPRDNAQSSSMARAPTRGATVGRPERTGYPAARDPKTSAPQHRLPGEPPLSAGPLANPKLTFDQFVIGDSNRLAHAAALTVAEMPAQAYNPLFICGPPGVGKTHLLSSIAGLLLSHSPGLTVRCTNGEAFTNEFIAALAVGHADGFKARFRDVDVLLIDDVQFLERKAKTEEEFFHTFNALHEGGRQIVVTSDRPPRDLQALEDRLRERFQARLVADIAPPDLATRLAILRMRACRDDIELDDDVGLTVIAERIHNNVRALEGALIRVVAFSSLTGRVITPELAHEVLDSLYPSSSLARRERSIGEIQSAACECFGVSSEELLSTTRSARVAWPRQVAMYLARELTAESLPAIGRQFGGRDRTTVLRAPAYDARLATDTAAREAVENLCRALGAPLHTMNRPCAPDRGA